jgi:hypothetical protein
MFYEQILCSMCRDLPLKQTSGVKIKLFLSIP